MHKIYMVDGSRHGVFSFNGIVGFLYVIIFAQMCAITCISKNGPIYIMKFWYQLFSKIVIIVMVLWSFFLI